MSVRGAIVDKTGSVVACIMVEGEKDSLPDCYEGCTLIAPSEAGIGDAYNAGVLVKKKQQTVYTAQDIADMEAKGFSAEKIVAIISGAGD